MALNSLFYKKEKIIFQIAVYNDNLSIIT